MLVYPQLLTGALAQYPIIKRHRTRTISNVFDDGSSIKLSDTTGETTEWELRYAGLTDDEARALEQFFAAAEGNLSPFTFLDPTANLFSWSDHLDRADWEKGPMLLLAGGQADPAGGTNAWHLYNSGGAPQRISQTLPAPGNYVYCLSAYAKSATAGAGVTLVRGPNTANYTIGPGWRRITFSGGANASSDYVEFGIEVPAGVALDIYGAQVEPQSGASGYKPSGRGGVYPETSFRDDTLAITAIDVNRHSATVNLIHAKHL